MDPNSPPSTQGQGSGTEKLSKRPGQLVEEEGGRSTGFLTGCDRHYRYCSFRSGFFDSGLVVVLVITPPPHST